MYRFTTSQWTELIYKYRSSGLSAWIWCRNNNIPRSSFYYHLKKHFSSHRSSDCDLVNDIATSQSSESAKLPEINEIVPLIIRDDMDTDRCTNSDENVSAKIILNGITVDLYNNIERSALINILSAVNNL